MGFAEGRVSPLVSLEDRCGQDQGFDGFAHPAVDLFLRWQILWDFQQDTQLGMVAAQPSDLIPPMPGI